MKRAGGPLSGPTAKIAVDRKLLRCPPVYKFIDSSDILRWIHRLAIIIFKGTHGDRKFEPEAGSPLRLRPVAPVARTRTLYRAPCAERGGSDAVSRRAALMLMHDDTQCLRCRCSQRRSQNYRQRSLQCFCPSPYRSSWSVVAGSTLALMMLMYDDTLRMRRRCKRSFSQNFRKQSVRFSCSLASSFRLVIRCWVYPCTHDAPAFRYSAYAM